ncbi:MULTISPECIES: alpha/beta fold hydrolase [unclassified Crossiella]|uniref:alpha/beta fold hydrolase n=1 Tax=unclassified Crossiella TaxID=2620835 RepID=UPI001FFF02B9|nr:MULTISPECIES: alpha/beta hydrolase [unclassified Crossiella]MCK2240356.1 alpha/beta hydrolase [Crossiella sp. S99.2]MCK2253192.1 alpha/beta hydrolase [Crossiella sp. S99.1]
MTRHTVLLAHGVGSTIEDSFGPILDTLAREHTVIAQDYPGSGATPPEPLTLDSLADRLVAGVEGPFTVLGFSTGTAVAVRIATRHPDRVNGLILTAGFGYPEPHLRLAINVWRRLIESGDQTALAEYLTLICHSTDYLATADVPALVSEVAKWLAQDPIPGAIAQLDMALDVDVRPDLPGVRVPTLVLPARGDVLCTPGHSRVLAAGIPGARLAELDCGHAVAEENGAAWAAEVLGFLSAV